MEPLLTLFIGAAGGLLAAATQHVFRRYAELEQVRREVVETHLLQLQDSVESLYYRMNNLRHWSGRAVMSEEYYLQTSAYIIGKVLAYESKLVAHGIYAKLARDTTLKRTVKAKLHAINWKLDDPSFYHYHRVQLAEMTQSRGNTLTFSAFLKRWQDDRFAAVVAAVCEFLMTVEPEQLHEVGAISGELVEALASVTGVPSAIELAESHS